MVCALPLVIQCQSESCLNVVWLAIVSFPVGAVVVFRKGNALADQSSNRFSVQDVIGMVDLFDCLFQTLGDDLETFLPTNIVIRLGSGDRALFCHPLEATDRCPIRFSFPLRVISFYVETAVQQ